MGNRVLLKKYGIIFGLLVVVFSLLLVFTNLKEYDFNRKTINYKIVSIVEKLKQKYPNISDEEILEVLNSNSFNNDYLRKYGYSLDEDTYVKMMEENHEKFLLREILIFTGFVLSLLLVVLIFYFKRNREIKNIIQIIEKINRKNYELKFDDYDEDELSILKSEIYKTTIMLKEAAENSLNDKINLKKSLSDISHQLKTPLTSILIMLDNILDDDEMDSLVRISFIKDIKKEVVKINFLVQSILKMAKFDSNTISYVEESVKLIDIANESVKNTSVLCDLKNIEVKIYNEGDPVIKCDKAWQIEALTNLIKNAVEHSCEGGLININIKKNNVYSEIIIEDFGSGIDLQDLEHIFERFYKTRTSNKDSIGIGLELSKKIIEAAQGRISVESKLGNGTKFTIKYFVH